MSCLQWQSALTSAGLEGLEPTRRRRFLQHLAVCSSCRQWASAEDPTILLAQFPAVEVSGDEVEEVRRTVRALRRVRDLERTGSHLVQRAFAGAAMAALLLVALLLSPERPRARAPERVPFVGAVGVGSGLIDLQIPTSPSRHGIEIELATERETLFRESLSVSAGQGIWRQLEGGYEIRFRLDDRVEGHRITLRGFRVSRTDNAGRVTLIEKDLGLRPESPLVLELSRSAAGEADSYLTVRTLAASTSGS